MDFDYVKDYHLQFNGVLQKRQKTDLIVLQHSEGGSAETVERIHADHMSEGHKGIDYNVCVQKDGAVVWGRGLEMIGGHTMNKKGLPTYGVNARSVGIVCLGNFNKNQMATAQKDALKRVVADIVRHYHFSSINQIVTHKEKYGQNASGEWRTDCPGTYFPADEVRTFIRSGGKTAEPTVQDPLEWRVTVGTLNFRKAADLKAPVLAQLHRGDAVKLERYEPNEDWARVIHDGTVGYVWLKYIGE